MKISSFFKSVLCLNGDLPKKSFIENLNVPIIASDGGANKLDQIGIKPEFIIGDLDSLTNWNMIDKRIIHIDDQDSTDFQKSLSFIKANDLFPPLVLGVNGGFIDQIINNINIIAENNCLFYDDPIIGIPLNANNTYKFSQRINSKISIIAMNKAIISSKGLKWNLNKSLTQYPGYNSTSNRNILEEFTIEIIRGKVLLLLYLKDIEDCGSNEQHRN